MKKAIAMLEAQINEDSSTFAKETVVIIILKNMLLLKLLFFIF